MNFLLILKIAENKLTTPFETQNKIAELKHTLSALRLEKEYFDEYFNTTHSEKSIFRRKDKLSLDKILTIWNELQTYIESEKSISFGTKSNQFCFMALQILTFIIILQRRLLNS